MKQHISLSGQFRIVKKSSDNQVLFDSGVLNNLLLDTGLDYFGLNHSNNIMRYLGVGTGNSVPTETQTKLDKIVAVGMETNTTFKNDYDPARDGEYYTPSRTSKYIFRGLNNINIAELGLVKDSNVSEDNTAYTRALIKDDSGRPLVITVLQGEVLEVYYTLKMVYRLQEKETRIALSDGRGGTRGFVKSNIKLAGVGGTNIGGSANYGFIVGFPLIPSSLGNNPVGIWEEPTLGTFQATPTGKLAMYLMNGGRVYTGQKDYVSKSYKKNLYMEISEDYNIPKLGALIFYSTMGFYQISFANESDNSPIDKNRTRTFRVELEISWGRDNRE